MSLGKTYEAVNDFTSVLIILIYAFLFFSSRFFIFYKIIEKMKDYGDT